MKKTILALLALAAAFAGAYEYPSLVVVHATAPADVAALFDAGVDVDYCSAPRADGVLAYVPPSAYGDLTALGFTYEVLYADARDGVKWTNDYEGPRYDGGDAIPYDHYLSYDEFAAAMEELATTYPTLCRKISIGKTWQDRDIWALKISKNPDTEEEEPECRLVGAHHGNERIGYMVALYATEHLLSEYNTNTDAKALVDGAEIWCVPMLNADGVVDNNRYNNHGVDLNRNYSYQWRSGNYSGPSAFSEKETQAIRDISSGTGANTFVMSHSYHSGAVYVNYVWNYAPEMPADVAMIQWLSNLYGSITGYPVTNGYAWYQTFGDLNDWSYGVRGDPDDTIEVSNSYNPPTAQILGICQSNWTAILQTFRPTQKNVVKGWVKDETTHEPLDATVTPLEINWPAYTDPAKGDYYKMLRPGTYTMKASATGYASATEANVVVVDGQPTTVNFYLRRTGSPVTLDYFRAQGRPGGVLLSWKVNGPAAAGYNLYRTAAGADARKDARERVNAAAITGRSPYRFFDEGTPAGRWRYELVAVDLKGGEEAAGMAEITYAGRAKALAFALAAPYPNPASGRGAVNIAFSLPAAADVDLTLYDLAGRAVARPAAGAFAAGEHDIAVPTANLAPGVYILRLKAGANTASRKLAVVR